MPQVLADTLANASIDDDIKLKMLIRESGKTQAQIADEIGVDRTYISQMANGKVSWTNSRYFPALTQALGMTEEQIRAVKPYAVIEMTAPDPAPRRGPPVPPVVPFRETQITIPAELLQMVEKYGDDYPVLKTVQMQRMLAAPRNFGGAEVGPQTAEDWFDYWMANKRFLT